MLRGARMPASSTAIFRSFSRRRISCSAARVPCGSSPRRASLAPSSRITASVPSGTDQSSRASPPAAVSPETPALAISTAIPLARSAASRRAGKAAACGSPKPAVSESPSATICTGAPAATAESSGAASAAQPIVRARRQRSVWTRTAAFAYEPCDAGRRTSRDDINDIARDPDLVPAIALSGLNLSLGRGAARVHILKDITLHIGRGEAIGLVGPSGSGKSTLLMVMAGLERPDTGSVVVAGHDLGGLAEDALARFRGRHVGIVFQSFHLIPTMTALENVAVPLELAGAGDAFARAEHELVAVDLAN